MSRIIAPIVTPLTPSGAVDEEGIRRVVEDLLSGGVDTIFALGSTGRGPWFSPAQSRRILDTVTDAVRSYHTAGKPGADRVEVLAGCIGNGVEDMLSRAVTAAEAGADGVVITAPGYFRYSWAEMESILTEVADRSPVPVFLYDIPSFTGFELPQDLILNLMQHARFAGFKDSSANYDRFSAVLRLAPAGALILQGKERLLCRSLEAGASGIVISAVHIAPRAFARLAEAVAAGDTGSLTEARRIQGRIDEVMDLVEGIFERRPETSSLFFFLQEVLVARGIDVSLALPFEGTCPVWITERANRAVELLDGGPK